MSEYIALPEFGANANAIAIQSVELEHEDWEGDTDLTEETEPALEAMKTLH